jgi:hypothetical protein
MGAERSLYRIIIPAMEPEAIAASAYRGYALGRTVIVPGLLGTLGNIVLRFAPHPLTVPLVGRLLEVDENERLRSDEKA